MFALLGLAKDSSQFFQYVKCAHSIASAFCGIPDIVVKHNDPVRLLGYVRHPKRVASFVQCPVGFLTGV